MQVQSIGLSERWTRIANILPSSISSGSNHPDLFVDPSGFRRVVTSSIKTCEMFLETLQKIEEGLEKRIPGITSYYGLVEASNNNSYGYTLRGGTVSCSGLTVSIPTSYTTTSVTNDSCNTIRADTKEPEHENAIFERAGSIILYKKRKLEQEEIISFERAIAILRKLDSLRYTTINCITTFGALDEVLEVGKVFSYNIEEKVDYIGEHAVKTTHKVEEDKISLAQYWGTLSYVNRIKTIEKKLGPELTDV